MKKTYFITGGTGSFANKFIFDLVKKKLAKKIIVFSRDEFKQMMMKELPHIKNNINLFRFYLGDVRDKNRLDWAMIDEVDTVIHSAALKQVPATEYNPFETVQTNILGTQNVIEVSIKKNIDKVLLISTDKAVSPINLYGSTKLTAEKLFISGNAFKGKKRCKFAVVRYGNVMGSRGSVIPILLRQNKLNAKFFTITHKSMTRFNITLKDASALVINCLKIMKGGEIFVPKLPSYNIIDLAKAINSKKVIKIIGIRTGEKMHEELISSVEFGNLKAKNNLYIIDNKNKYKNMKNEKLFNSYNSLTNPDYLNIKQINTLIKKNQSDFEN